VTFNGITLSRVTFISKIKREAFNRMTFGRTLLNFVLSVVLLNVVAPKIVANSGTIKGLCNFARAKHFYALFRSS
jgi:hypothetical protein